MKKTDSTVPRFLGAAALAGVLLFAAIGIAAQFLRPDLDWLQTPLSFYLLDPHGLWVRAGYFALALALIALGGGWYLELSPQARSAAPLLLFVCAGLALAVTAVAETGRRGQPVTLETLVHGLAAQTAFLCVTTAMLLQAWRLRADPRWRQRFAIAFAVAVAAFVGLWVHALWREAPRGLSQKLEIGLILLWLGSAANRLRKGASRAAQGAPALSQA
ncbi:DUF998 domain-containing protein [Marilutibacter maris]|uniref:DUF998 domain-containing protein n=1 Tax=Marilutibacter maris TaxID=1605891 RepID=A0A2U9T4T2_9GAMM|nr:DUF998 domain-containing protein [Lysobacter maris]AWV07523.1 hypothetical protein C9I47_1834 [Lysobacter maris]